MGQARTWTGWGCLLLGVVGALVVLGAQEPTKITPVAPQKGAFGQFTDREQWQMPIRVMDELLSAGNPNYGAMMIPPVTLSMARYAFLL